MGKIRKSRLSRFKQVRLAEHFAAGTTARTAASLCRVNRKTAALYFLRLREIIAFELEAESASMFGSEIEVDESYFGGRRKGKRGRGAAGKIPVFGLLKRGGKVYTKIIPNASSATLIPIIERKVVPDSIVYSDSWRGYNVLDISEFHLCRVKTPSAAEIVAFPATAGYRRRHAHDHHDYRRHAARDLPQPRVATPGNPRPPPAGGNSEAGKATAVPPDARPRVLGHPFPPLAALARGAGDRKAGNRHRLAPEGISCVLDLEIQARQTRTASGA